MEQAAGTRVPAGAKPVGVEATGEHTDALQQAVLRHARVDVRGYRPAVIEAALAERRAALADQVGAAAAYLARLGDAAGGEARALVGAIEQQGWSGAANPLADGLSLHTLSAAWRVLGVRPGREPAFKIWLPACPDPTPAQMLAQWLAQQPLLSPEPTAPRQAAPSGVTAAPELTPGWVVHASSIAQPPEGAAAPLRWHVHRALHDLPLPGCDLIVCHGVLAPLRPDVRRRVLRRFARALAPHGMLWLDEGSRQLATELALVPVGDTLVYRCASAATPRAPGLRPEWADRRIGGRPDSPGRGAAAVCAPTGWADLAALHATIDGRLAARPAEPMAVVAIDLDHHGDLRRRFGHAAAEQLQDAAARTISASVQATGWGRLPPVLARAPSGGWFVVLPGAADPAAALPVVQRLQDALGRMRSPDGRALSWSAGVSAIAGAAATVAGRRQAGLAARLIHQAETALARACRCAPAGVALCGPALVRELDAHALVVAELPAAVANGQLALHYQPQFDVLSGALAGVEALVRWRHPERGLLMPDEFIAPAEAAGLIGELGDWVLREACLQARAWQRLGLPAVPMAVNVSVLQLGQADFADRVAAALAGADLAPQWLELELTEGTLMREPEAAQPLLTQCRQRGVRVSLDDFGMGYSSLGALHRFQVDRVKIDRSFVAAVPGDRRAEAIIRAVIGLARELGLQVVAEGVESATQLAWLRQCGCHVYQGHLSARALEPALAEQHLRAARAAPA